MRTKDRYVRALCLAGVMGLLVSVACATTSNKRKATKKPAPAVTTEAPARAITTGDIAIWSRDANMLGGAWMRTQGLNSKKKLADGISFELMATDRSEKPLSPPPTWSVSDPAVASVAPRVGAMVTVTVLRAGKTTIDVKSGSHSMVLSLAATADGATLHF
jgi:hypothetical protein